MTRAIVSRKLYGLQRVTVRYTSVVQMHLIEQYRAVPGGCVEVRVDIVTWCLTWHYVAMCTLVHESTRSSEVRVAVQCDLASTTWRCTAALFRKQDTAHKGDPTQE